jgi:hypothetical protein
MNYALKRSVISRMREPIRFRFRVFRKQKGNMNNLMKPAAVAANTGNGNAVAVPPGGGPPPKTAVAIGLVMAAVAAFLAGKCLSGR